MLRKKGVVEIVEFYGTGLRALRCPIAPPSPTWREYGATWALSIDAETLNYLRFTARPEALCNWWSICKEQGLFARTPRRSDFLG